jgi:peptide/nickel transport system permease protein
MLLRHARRILMTVLLGGLLSVTLVRLAPGLDSDEDLLDARFSAQTQSRKAAARQSEANIAVFYARSLAGYFTGDWGESRNLRRPVRQLIGERAGVTAGAVTAGLAMGWLLGLAGALAGVRSGFARAGVAGGAALVQCAPAALLALVLVAWGARGPQAAAAAIGLILYSRVAPFASAALETAARMPHIRTARARGVGEGRILFCHLLPVARPQLAGLAAMSVSLAVSAAVPVETILDSPGLGQLMWQAALGRDLPLLVNLTVAVSLVVSAAAAVSDASSRGAWRAPAEAPR